MSLELREVAGGLLLRVAARPNAGRSALQGEHAGALKVALGAPPEKGKANRELIEFLAKTLGLKRAQVTLHSGQTSRNKVLRIEGLSPDELRAKLS